MNDARDSREALGESPEPGGEPSLLAKSSARTVASPPSARKIEKRRLAVPDAAAQEKASATIRDVYAEEFKSGKAALAKKLVLTARETQDPVDRFALLQSAKDIAADTGQGELAFAAIDALASEFDVSASELKAEVIQKGAAMVHTSDQKRALADAALQVLDEAVREDNLAAAKTVVRRPANWPVHPRTKVYSNGSRRRTRKWTRWQRQSPH